MVFVLWLAIRDLYIIIIFIWCMIHDLIKLCKFWIWLVWFLVANLYSTMHLLEQGWLLQVACCLTRPRFLPLYPYQTWNSSISLGPTIPAKGFGIPAKYCHSVYKLTLPPPRFKVWGGCEGAGTFAYVWSLGLQQPVLECGYWAL